MGAAFKPLQAKDQTEKKIIRIEYNQVLRFNLLPFYLKLIFHINVDFFFVKVPF